MKHRIWIIYLAFVALFTGSCVKQEFYEKNAVGVPIQLAADYQTTTRVTDAGFADGDRMGVFITDYVNGVPQPISMTGNRANNLLFTYNESDNSWKGATTVYWKDKQTPVDIVGYYPFDSEMTSASQYKFRIQEHQETAATNALMRGYEASDFLWAKSSQVAPTADVIHLAYKHLLAGITVRLERGTGFTEKEWEEAVKQVWVDNTIPVATVNLENGTVVAEVGMEDPIRVVPLLYNNEYRAVVVPQEVAAGKPLIGVTINGTNYFMTKESAMTYTSGKMHICTIIVNKSIDEGDYEFVVGEESVIAWVDDPEFHDGLIREYIVVEVEEPGIFEQCLQEKGLDPQKISSLKVKGKVNWEDLEYMGHNMPALTYLNLYEVRIDDTNDENDDVIIGFCDNNHNWTPYEDQTLTRIVLPKVLRGIGESAFYGTSLSGSIEIPEGVTFIGANAFAFCPFHAEIKLPSTLKSIESRAFFRAELEGELKLPDGLEYIGDEAFDLQGITNNLLGKLTLPTSLEYIGSFAFWGTQFQGDVVIPQNVEFGDFGRNVFTDCLFNHVEIPEGVTGIGMEMFLNVPLQGELLLPASLKYLKNSCFRNTKISSVVLPEGLKTLEKNVFSDCSRLEGVITIPNGITVIQEETFARCTMLSGVRLHENVVYIAKGAFQNCYNMNTLVCNALTPPVVEDGAFDGVPKDNFSVEVPASAVPAYKMAEGWKEFKRITAYSDFVCRPTTVCALNTMHEETLVLNAEGKWRVTHRPEWCELSQYYGIGRTSIQLTISQLERGFGDRKDSIVFALDDKDFTTYCTILQKDYEYGEDELVPLQLHSKGKGIDILFLGDGYDADALASGAYMNLVREEMEYFFALPPYDRFREYFNVYAAVSLSQETGINTVNTYCNTRFGTIYGGSDMCGGSGPNLIPDDELIFPYITETLTDSPFTDDKLRRTLVILIPNTSEYNGVSYVYEDGRAISICPRSEQAYPNDTRGVVQREAGGFGFGKLGNEAVTKNAYATSGVLESIRLGQERGWYQNISTSGKMAEVPWAHFIFDPRYSDYVDIFEGGFEYTRNIFRSEASSCLNTGIPYYNAISRQVITMRIMEYAGESFSMDDFYANDTNAWGPTGQTTRSIAPDDYPVGTPTGFTNPVVVTSKFIPNKPKRKNK